MLMDPGEILRACGRSASRRAARLVVAAASPGAPGSPASTRTAPPRSACRPPSADPLEAVLINTAGGLTGGDRIAWQVDVGAGASRHRHHPGLREALPRRLGPGRGRRRGCRVGAGRAARLAAAGNHRLRPLRLRPPARCRPRRGRRGADRWRPPCSAGWPWARRVRQALFRDRWRVRQNGRLVHAEDFAIGPRHRRDARPSRRHRRRASPWRRVLLVAPDAESRARRGARRSSATTAAPAPGASAELASFLRGCCAGTAIGCASGWCR